MAKSCYTFIIVPNASSRLRKLKLPTRVLHALAAVGVLAFFVLVGLGFSYVKMAFKAADYDKLQVENTNLKIQKKNLEVATVKLGEKLVNIENLFEKIQNLVENDNLTKRGKLNVPAVGGSKVDYPTAELLGSGNLKNGVELLKDRTAEMETQLTLLEQVAEKKATIRRFTPTIWPVKGNITSHYGNRADPFNGEAELHLGLDISALFGTQVHAPADGKIIYAQRKAAYGNLIIIDHGNGLTTRLGHLSRFNVKVGQKVRKNDIVGYVGTSGRSTAPHLHYEVRLNDRPINPRNYLPRG
ncbi:MAG TPA: M23 family metallopeptidase [Terriglobia bacterium]|nr:M23 family metallopeptidase [Terriglobia bacterium]